jgi:hypothetical protein
MNMDPPAGVSDDDVRELVQEVLEIEKERVHMEIPQNAINEIEKAVREKVVE